MSSMVSFSKSFFLEVACLDLEAFELNLWINDFNSLARSVTFLFSFCFCFFLAQP